MTTVKDIQEGKYCPDCSWNCIHFNRDADCCACDTIIGRMYSQCVHNNYVNQEMKYEKRA